MGPVDQVRELDTVNLAVVIEKGIWKKQVAWGKMDRVLLMEIGAAGDYGRDAMLNATEDRNVVFENAITHSLSSMDSHAME